MFDFNTMRSCRLSGHLIETWDQGWKSNSNNSWWSTVSHRLMWNHLVLLFLPYFSLITDYCPYLVLEFIQSSSRTILSNIRYLTPLRPERYPIDSRGGELLRLVPCVLVWHHRTNIFFLPYLAKLKLKTSNIYVTMKKKHSGQAPTLLVLIWELSQFWPCHTNTLGFQKSFEQ